MAPTPGGERFLLLYRRRVFNPAEGKWMGWERKRGKLHELNRLLRGAPDTTFTSIASRAPRVPAGVRYVITLDADTRLPRDACVRLIGKMAHPLNRPKFSNVGQRIVSGYAILQPRVTPSLPIGREGSLYQRVFSGPGGLDPYASTVSDVYQDLFGEGSFTGKGIYDVDAFEAALRGRIPENTLLSHDLFEGVFARAGLASDIEVVEEVPSRYDVVGKRQHRWTRGDWQLLPWIARLRTGPDAMPPVGRWKMLDNLRRSLLAPCALATLGVSWLLPLPAALAGVLIVLGAIAIPAFLPVLFSLVPHRTGIRLDNHFRSLGGDLRTAALQTLLSVAFLADRAWEMSDAIVRTLVRLLVTRRHLLEWTTAAQAGASPRLELLGFYRRMAGGTALGLALASAAIAIAPLSWPLVLPFALLWALAPMLALWASRSPTVAHKFSVSESDACELRLTARRTWRYFETFVTPADRMLPPDNFQETPKPVVAHRTSPTNIGLYLLGAVAARDFGWAGTVETVERIEATFASLRKLERCNGHFLNWYGTRDLRALAPAYVSSVDSGNLAGHLIVLANACDDWADDPVAPQARLGLLDDLLLARETAGALSASAAAGAQATASGITEVGAPITQIGTPFAEIRAPLVEVRALLEEIGDLLSGPQALESLSPALKRLADKAARVARDVVPPTANEGASDLVFWIEALARAATEHGRDRSHVIDAPAAAAPKSQASHPRRSKLLRRSLCIIACGHWPPRRARWLARWTSRSWSIPTASCCRSATRLRTIVSTRAATTCSRPRHGSPASSRSPRATSRPRTGFAWAGRRPRWATDRH